MMAVDTNVIVRFLVRDDEKQADAVRRRLKMAEERRERLKIPLLVALEIIWVLDSAYGKTRSEILDSFRDMRQMAVFEFEAERVIDGILNDGTKHKADLADLLIAYSAEALGCQKVLTLDQGAAKHPLFSLLK